MQRPVEAELAHLLPARSGRQAPAHPLPLATRSHVVQVNSGQKPGQAEMRGAGRL